MKKIACLVLSAVAYIGVANAQNGTITGKITDPKGIGLAGAVIEYNLTSTPDVKRHETSAAGGAITLRNLAPGAYNVKLSFLGYKTIEKTINVGSGTANLGTMVFEEDSQQITTVEVDAIAIRTSQRGDTISYNANAFRVNADADVEGLLVKMPGITVAGGKVEAHGEEIKRVYLNGKEVFGDDVSAAITSIPADMVDRVEVFNKLSDDAEFTGIDDGQGFKALNIVTPEDRRTAHSGRIYGAYGYDDKYLLGAKLNIINNESTLILNGLFNNINQQNFSFDDLSEAASSGYSSDGGRMWQYMRPQEGIATTQAIAVNYNDMWGKMRTINGQQARPIKFSGNFSFRHLDTYDESQTWRWDYLSLTSASQNRYSETSGISNSGRYDTRLGGRIDWTINESNQLMLRPQFNLQFSDSFSESDRQQFNFSDPSNPMESALMQYYNKNENNRWGLRAGLNGNWRTRLGKAGRTLVFNFGGRYNLNNGLSLPEQWIGYYQNVGQSDVTRVQKIISDTYSYSLNGGVTYTEPLSQKSALTIEYRADYNYSDSERLAYLDPNATYPFTVDHNYNDDYDDVLSSIYNSGYMTQRVTPGFRYGSEKLNFNVGVSYENAFRTSDQTTPSSRAGYKSYSFDNILYSAMMTYNINKTNSLRIRLNSSARNPSIDQLQDVIDETSIINISTGNPDLKPAYQHRLWANYVLSNVNAGTTLTIAASFGGSNNTIGQALQTSGNIILSDGTTIAIPEGGYFSRPENMKGAWNSFVYASYGFPIKWIKSNMTFGVNGFFSESPSLIDDISSMRSNNFYSADVTLGSNISQNIDFTIGYRAGYNISTGTSVVGGATFSTPNESFMQYVSASLKWVIWQGITFSANAMYTQNLGITDNYNDEYLIINAFLGKKLLKSQRLEIAVGVNDMLDQNRAFRRTVQSTYIQNSQNLALGRYFAIQVTYNLNNAGNAGNRPSQGDRRMGPGMRR